MGHLTPLIASTSVGGWIELLIILGLLFLDYWATMRIITQAGYSSMWILLPLAPLVLTIICYVILFNDLHEIYFGGGFGFAGVGNANLFWNLDKISILLNWVFYMVFAFSRWPAVGTSRAPSPSPLQPTPTRVMPNPPSRPPATAALIPSAGAVPSAAGPGAGSVSTPVAPTPNRPASKFCPWCAEALPGNRALFHDCGSKDRPEAFCRSCGTALPVGSTECGACGAA
jgi:hypothetical protein